MAEFPALGHDVDLGRVLEDSDHQAQGDQSYQELAEPFEPLGHCVGEPPQPEGDQQRSEHDGDQVDQNQADGEAGGQAGGQDADRDAADAGQDALREVPAVFLVDDSQRHRDGEDHRRAHHGPEYQAGQLGGLCVGGHLLGQGPATHVTGEEGAGEHRRVCSDK